MSRRTRTVSVPKATAAGLVVLVAALAWTTLAPATPGTEPRNGSLTVFTGGTTSLDSSNVGRIGTVGGGKHTRLWRCPGNVWCGEPVSFAWAPDGRRVAFTLDELGGTSTYVGLRVVNVVSGRDMRVPGGAPKTASITDDPVAWNAYYQKTQHRVGCFPAAEFAWAPDGTRLAYICRPDQQPYRQELDVLKLRGSGHTTIPTNSEPFWPSWSASGTRIAYSTQLTPSSESGIYTIALDGSHKRLAASGGAAPAWSPNGRTIAYQTTCGIRLVTPSGMDVTPRANANACGAIGHSGPPVWSPDGTKLAAETSDGIYVMNKNGGGLHRVSKQATTTWYGGLPGRPSWRPIRQRAVAPKKEMACPAG